MLLSQESFRHIGETLNGTHWQSDVARDLGCSKSQITRYLDTSGNPRTSRSLSPLVAEQLQHIVVQRIGELAALFEIEGMPYSGKPEAENAVKAIAKALGTIPGRKPAKHRTPA